MEKNDNSLLSVLEKLTGLIKKQDNFDNDRQSDVKKVAFSPAEKKQKTTPDYSATNEFVKKHTLLANKIKDKNRKS